MKHRIFWTRAALIVLCFLTVISFASCKADMEVGNNTELGKEFVDHMLADEYDAAYDMIKQTATPEEFYDYWEEIQVIVEGAADYEIEQIGWNIRRNKGVETRTSAYQVYFDNDKIALLRIVTIDSVEGIAGLHMSDVTGFVNRTDSFVPILNILLIVISVLVIAFVIWMFVDCLRRKIRKKVLWAILMFVGVAFTVTIGGGRFGVHFSLGIMFQTSSMAADPALLAVVTKIVVPVGAIVYFFLRKRLTVKPAPADMSENAEASPLDYMPAAEVPSMSDEEPSVSDEEPSVSDEEPSVSNEEPKNGDANE